MEQLYVLQCKSNKYYIGKTTDIMRRYQEHQSGKGSSWTTKYPPIRIELCRPLQGDHDENNITKDYMKKYGIEHIKGGIYTQVYLPLDIISVLQKELQGVTDLCYKCNLAGHVASSCKKKEEKNITKKSIETCYRCQREGHTLKNCYATKDINGIDINDTEEIQIIYEKKCKKKYTTSSDTCYRCGREGHYSDDCYASRHVKGYELY